jgi:hypothetical protein
MIILIIIIILCFLIWRYNFSNRESSTYVKQKDRVYTNTPKPIIIEKPSGEFVFGGPIKTKEIEKTYFRKTYVKGVFTGKFKGKFNKDLINESNWYDLIHLESKIAVNESDVVRYTDANKQLKFSKLLTHENEFNFIYPDKLCTEINKGQSTKEYFLEYKDKQLSNIEFYHSVKYGDDVFVTIKGDFIGYTEHPETVFEILEYQEQFWVPGSINENSEVESEKETINTAISAGVYKSTPRIPISASSKISIWDIVIGILSLLFVLYYIIQICFFLYFGWPILLFYLGVLAVVFGVTFLNYIAGFIFSKFRWLGNYLMYGLVIGLISIFISSLINYKKINYETELYVPENDTIETRDPVIENVIEQTVVPEIDSVLKPISNYLIKNIRVWKDYDGNIYRGTFTLSQNLIKESESERESIPFDTDYNSVINDLCDMQSTKDGLSNIYEMFDSIQRKKKLSRMKFAEMIVTCVQDIPYTLILPKQCDPEIYNDRFIYDYLNAGNKCEPNVKFGLYSPVEFTANLIGDCDTRTILLYSLLKNYNFDVVVLGSEQYGHSILGINLPYHGISKKYRNKNYVVWETTAPGVMPGVLPREISNMNNWEINLN